MHTNLQTLCYLYFINNLQAGSNSLRCPKAVSDSIGSLKGLDSHSLDADNSVKCTSQAQPCSSPSPALRPCHHDPPWALP